MISRTASDEMFFSARSRWHSKTIFSASKRFVLASASVSPCEIAAGISCTKQVYPPSLAGSKTAVSFMRIDYHTPILLQRRWIRNKSKNTVRGAELFIRYTFLWKNEYHFGKDDPSTAFYQTVTGDIAPGGSIRFKFTPSPPLPQRSDGKFEGPSVSIAGFAQIIPQKR